MNSEPFKNSFLLEDPQNNSMPWRDHSTNLCWMEELEKQLIFWLMMLEVAQWISMALAFLNNPSAGSVLDQLLLKHPAHKPANPSVVLLPNTPPLDHSPQLFETSSSRLLNQLLDRPVLPAWMLPRGGMCAYLLAPFLGTCVLP